MISFYKHDHGQNVTKRNVWRLNSPQTVITDRFQCHATKKNKLETIQWKRLRKWNVIIKRLICKQFVQVSGNVGHSFRVIYRKVSCTFVELCVDWRRHFGGVLRKQGPWPCGPRPAARSPRPATAPQSWGPAAGLPGGWRPGVLIFHSFFVQR